MLWLWRQGRDSGIYNVGTGQARSFRDLVLAMFAALGSKPNIEYIDMPENIKNQYQYFTEADLSKLRKAGCPTRFRPLNTAVKDYVQNHLLKKDPYL